MVKTRNHGLSLDLSVLHSKDASNPTWVESMNGPKQILYLLIWLYVDSSLFFVKHFYS